MVFKRIELNGFKSFADPVTMEFTEGITCIVGPNGSGKSNISDAIRWVLGEQSPKMLRGGKMEEVIFSGTQSRKPKGMAEVTIVLDNSGGTLPIDFSEVAITRRMYRSGDSEYQINRSPCRLKDIRELIMDTGMGVEGYSIIGQGKIADIVDNKMDSRREIFEEAAGIVKYRSKKDEAERKLESASANLSRVNDIIGEIRGRIQGLAQDSEKAQEYLVLRDQYKEIEINITLRSIESVGEKSEAVRQELLELNGAVDSQKTDRELLENQLRLSKKDGQDLETETEGLRDRMTLLSEEIHQIASQKELSRERLTALRRDLERLEGERGVLEEKLRREESNAAALGESSAQVDQENLACQAEVQARELALRGVSGELAAEEQSLQQYKDRLFELANKLSAGRSEITSLLSLRDTLLKRSTLLESEGSLSDETDKVYAADLQRTQNELNERTREVLRLEQEIKTLQGDKGELVRREAELSRKLGEQTAAGSRMKTRQKLLEELEEAYEGYGGGVQFLMRRKLPGMIGVVGELIQVPKGLETAIEIALGAALQNIVCRDDAAAKEAIGLLKANQAGRLTFLPLDSIRSARTPVPERLRTGAGFLGIAADRVSCREGAAKALDYLLGRVALCQDLDSAFALSKLSEGSFRFVTLQGEVVNASGAITGGSLRSNTGSILSRKAEIARLGDQIRESEAEILAVRKEHSGILEQLESLLQRIRTSEETLRETEKDSAVKRSQIQQMENLADHSAKSSQRRLSELADLKEEVGKVDAGVSSLREGLETQQREMDSLGGLTAALSDTILAIKGRMARAAEAETAARMALGNASVRRQSARALEARVQESLLQLKEELLRKEEEIARAELQLRQLADPSEDAQSLLTQKEEERRALETRLTQLQDRRHAASLETEALDAQRLVFEQELYALQMRQREAEVRQAKFETQMETLKEKLWEEFEMSYVQAMAFEKSEFVMSRALKDSREIKDRMRVLGEVNIGAIKEYEQVRQRYDFLQEQEADLNRAISELNAIIEDMDSTIRKRFKESFDAIEENFEAAFTDLFGGGHARLFLEDPDRPLESGIVIEAQPPGKKLQNMGLLSGGEKTMTAIALMFAVLKAKPTPFCILDEVEAALDEPNIDSFARYLRKFQHTQFALVTHQKATMEYADVLYGITTPEKGISTVLSLKLGDSFELGNTERIQ